MYKDLAKYWIGFVPVATLISLGVALAPNADQLAQVGLSDWIDQRWPILIALGLVVGALIGMTWTCAYVLAAEPTKFGDLLSDANWLSDAFSKYGVGRPYFLDSSQFTDAETKSRELDDSGQFDPRASAVNDVTARVSALSADLNAKARFRTFGLTFAGGVVVVIGGVLFVLASSASGLQIITDPTPVTVHVPAGAVTSLRKATGCQVAADTSAVAVGGTWTSPKLRLFGKGCKDIAWVPSADLHVLITKA